jgi:hypothetical protein
MLPVLRLGPCRFYFYNHKPNEPAHVYVDRDNLSAKFWLDPVQLARNLGFSPKDLRVIEGMVVGHQQELQEKWDGYFDTNR